MCTLHVIHLINRFYGIILLIDCQLWMTVMFMYVVILMWFDVSEKEELWVAALFLTLVALFSIN